MLVLIRFVIVVYIYRVAGLLRRVPVRCRLHLLFILFTCGHDGTELCLGDSDTKLIDMRVIFSCGFSFLPEVCT